MAPIRDNHRFLSDLAGEISSPKLILDTPKKLNFALISGILPDEDLDSSSDEFSKFFDNMINVTFRRADRSRANTVFVSLLETIKNTLLANPKVDIEENEFENLLRERDICDAIINL